MLTMKDSFEKFDSENPRIWELFKQFAKQALSAGKSKLSVSLIVERIRWEVTVVTTGDVFKINNNHRAFYARKFHDRYPEYGDVFETRKQSFEK